MEQDCTNVMVLREAAQRETISRVVLVMKLKCLLFRKAEIDEVFYTLSPMRA
jgi:hypothetical protein